MNHSPVVISQRIVEARVDRLDVRAERFELLGRRGDGGRDFRIDAWRSRASARRRCAARRCRRRGRPSSRTGRAAATSSRARRAASARSSSAPRRPRSSCAGRGATTVPNGESGCAGHAAEARLEAEVAAERGRDAHAAGAVGADRQRPQAGGDRSRRAARRPAAASSLGSHGLRVMPVIGELVSPLQPNSGVVVLPRSTAPASRKPRGRRRVDVPRLVGIDGALPAQRRPPSR